MPLKALLFDLDNTLVDFMRMKRGSCEAAVSAMIANGVKLDQEKAMKILFELYDQYGIEYSHIFEKFLEKVNHKTDYKLVAAGVVAYRKAQAALLQPYSNVVPTLLRLRERGLKLAIVSDAPSMRAWMRLTELGLQDFFDVVVTFDDTGERKPSPLPFEKALRELGLKPSEVLMTGDWPERDVAGAKALGIRTCFARYGFQPRSGAAAPANSGADYELSSFEQILAVVDKEAKRK
jgi:putative hydrolase of the HAD superfamily